jgi:hypothetical protein
MISTMTGLFLARSPARALNRWVSSAVRPEKWGMPARSHEHAIRTMDLGHIRKQIEKRVADEPATSPQTLLLPPVRRSSNRPWRNAPITARFRADVMFGRWRPDCLAALLGYISNHVPRS